MISLCHGWDWQPPQTASHIPIRHLQSVLAHWYAVHWNTVAALHNTHTTWLRLWDTLSLLESKWWHCIMVETDSHLKLLPAFILNIYKAFEHTVAALNRYTYTTWLRLWGYRVTCGVKMMSLHHGWGWQPPQTAPCIHVRYIYTQCLSTLMCLSLAYNSSLTQLNTHYLAQILGYWVTCGVKMMSMHHAWWLKATLNCFLHPS